MVSYSERRHRLNDIEIEPVKNAVHNELLKLLENREDLLTASILFRVFYRMKTHCTNKPAYPPHDTWAEIGSWLKYGTETERLEALHDEEEASP